MRRRRAIGLAALAALAGCYGPELADGLPCSPEGNCPEGQTCAADGVCYRQPPVVADAAGADARPDRLIDPAVRVTDTAGLSDAPSLVWTGSEYAVAFVDDRGGNDEIFLARVAPDGELVGELRITDSVGEARDPSLVWTGDEYAVAWVDDLEGNFEVYLARVSASGELAAGPLRITDDPEFSGSPFLAWTESELAVVWNDGRDGNFEIYLARMQPDGVKIGGDVRLTTDDSFSATPSLAWTGDQLAMTWSDSRDGNNEIYFARIDAGTVVGGDIRVTDQAAYSSSPKVLSAGAARAVVWLDLRDPDREVYFARLSPGGTSETGDVLLSDLAAATGSATSVSAAWTGEEVGVAYATSADPSSDLLFTRRDLDGASVAAEVAVADGPEGSVDVDLVWTGSVYAVAWADDRDGNFEIYLRELAP